MSKIFKVDHSHVDNGKVDSRATCMQINRKAWQANFCTFPFSLLTFQILNSPCYFSRSPFLVGNTYTCLHYMVSQHLGLFCAFSLYQKCYYYQLFSVTC